MAPTDPPAEYVDPVIEAYKKDVDRTLIRENLKLSAEQRLTNLMNQQRFVQELQRGMRAATTMSDTRAPRK
jgi:predicted signal transduction protein with EAL and GGDEF domain